MQVGRALRSRRASPILFAIALVMTGIGMFGDGSMDLADVRLIGVLMLVCVTIQWSMRVAVIPLRDLASEFYDKGRRDERRDSRTTIAHLRPVPDREAVGS